MASQGLARCLRAMRTLSNQLSEPSRSLQHFSGPSIQRSMASLTLDSTSNASSSNIYTAASLEVPAHIASPTVLTTIYSFPSLEPLRFHSYPRTHLGVPLRRDILHRAVIFEGDATRQGTASTKWRDDVHGSGRKIRPQKGTGRARLGDRKSPMLRGGGVAFGPKPRDFSSKLQKKVYDKAWRMALSYRYAKGELFVIDEAGGVESELVREILESHGWGNEGGRSLFVTQNRREGLFEGLQGSNGRHGRALTVGDVDVKDLLELGRVVLEQEALESILEQHQSDLATAERSRLSDEITPARAEELVEAATAV